MPQLPFVQGMAIAALLAIALVVVAIPVGARVGARAGAVVLRASVIGVVLAFAGLLGWGAASGDLAVFNARMGVGSWLQMGAFFGIIYLTGYRFVASYLADKAREGAPHAEAVAHEGGQDA